jgi:hypothetical protein
MVDRDNAAPSPNEGQGAVSKTTDYSRFKYMAGNRELQPGNVKRLVRSMIEYGNLTAKVPILVNEDFEIVDGQHRLEALKTLEWPVYYRVEEGLNLSVVRALNNTGANWTWRDYATSYAPTKESYRQFLELSEKYGFGWNILTVYTGLSNERHRNADFIAGDFEFPNYSRTCELLEIAHTISEDVGFKFGRFMRALYQVLINPEVDRTRLLHKMDMFGKQLIKPAVSEAEYLREIEDCYNYKSTEENRVRLF